MGFNLKRFLTKTRRAWLAVRAREESFIKSNKLVRKVTATDVFYRAYGRKFMETFPELTTPHFSIDREHAAQHESTRGIVFRTNKRIGIIKLGFEPKGIVIEAIQGMPVGEEANKRANKQIGMPWQTFLVKYIEQHARETGYKWIRIQKPETLFWFQHAAVDSPQEVRDRMRTLYRKVAESRKFREEKEYWVKELN